MKKRILSLFIAVCVIFSVVPVTVSAASGASVTFEAIAGNDGMSSGEGYNKLCDGSSLTKWFTKFVASTEVFVVLRSSEPVAPTGYTFVTGNDTGIYFGRNPKSWTLYACNDYDESNTESGTWCVLDDVSDDVTLKSANLTAFKFAFENNTEYKYYKFVFHEAVKGTEIQLAEISFGFCDHNFADVKTASEATCTEPEYLYKTCDVCNLTATIPNGTPLGHNMDYNSRCERCLNTFVGDFAVYGGSLGTDFTFSSLDGVLRIKTSTPLKIKNQNAAKATSNIIFVEKNVSANIILSGVNIDVSGTGAVGSKTGLAAFEIEEGGTGTVTVTLEDGTVNILKSGVSCAGLQKNGTSGALVIDGNGALLACGGNDGAGIGGGYYGNTTNITVKSGIITANGGKSGAGIGSGNKASCGDIFISGGSVHALGGSGGNNIGGSNGKVTPKNAPDGENVYPLILDNPKQYFVTVDGEPYAVQSHSAINENNNTFIYLYLTAEEHAVSFDVNQYRYKYDTTKTNFVLESGVTSLVADCDFEIQAADALHMTAFFGYDYTYSDGVLTVCSNKTLKIKNKDSAVAADDTIVVAKDVSANIILSRVNIDVSGTGAVGSAAFKIEDDSTGTVTVTLEDGTVNTLKSGVSCAGLQKNGTSGALVVDGNGALTVCGGNGGAGIGGGNGKSASNITLKSCTITAKGGENGASIGGGNGGECGDIFISGGSVHAIAGKNAEVIGGSNGNVTPKNAPDGEEVYLLTLPNPDGKFLMIDNKICKPLNHKAIDEEGNENLYAYVTGEDKTVVVGFNQYVYRFDNPEKRFDEYQNIYIPSTWQFEFEPTDEGETLNFGYDYIYKDGVMEILSNKGIMIKNAEGFPITSHTVLVKKDVSANVTLAGVNIDVSGTGAVGSAAFNIEDDSTGTVTVTLEDGTVNTLKSGVSCAGLQKNGTSGALVVDGNGALTACGGNGGAGIGGGNGKSASNITLKSCTITAKGGENGASIGGGNGGECGDIFISGGSVHAIAGKNAEVIGGSNGNVTPKNAPDGEEVYLLTLPNPDGKILMIDNKICKPLNHKAIDEEGNENLYAYVTGEDHTVSLHIDLYKYEFNSLTKTFKKSETVTLLSDIWDLQIAADDPKEEAEFSVDYIYADGVLTVLTDKKVTVKNKDGVKVTSDTVLIKKDVSANVTLAGVNIDVSGTGDYDYDETGFAAFKIEDMSNGDVTVTLAKGTKNVLRSGYGCAGLQKNGFNATCKGKLTINGEGELLAEGGNNSAGIGGGDAKSGYIYINSGIITANGGNDGAGIGGGDSWGDGEYIYINGGTVTAKGGDDGAGIGGGDDENGEYIYINGGTVTAIGGNDSAGIGGGASGNGKYIHINGGTVTATGGNDGAGIGGGDDAGDGKNIYIYGGTVNAKGGRYSAGIGGGEDGGYGKNIYIYGGTVTAIGGNDGAGIGGGESGGCSDIFISGGSVHAIAGANSYSIGGYDGALTPKKLLEGSADEDVYLAVIPNPDSKVVYIDGEKYEPVNHKAIIEDDNVNLYAYLTGVNHSVKVGDEFTCYHYDSGAFTTCEVEKTYAHSTEKHWHKCTDVTCTVLHGYESHTNEGIKVGTNQYQIRCKICSLAGTAKDIPTVTVNGADKVCRTQDYNFTFTLPDGVVKPVCEYSFGTDIKGTVTPVLEKGVYSGTVSASEYAEGKNEFDIILTVETSDGYKFNVSKTVTIQNAHTFENGVCTVCGNNRTYSVEFNSDGKPLKKVTGVKWSDKVLDGISTPTKQGWKFSGWKCDGVTVNEKTLYSELAADKDTASITLTAVWEDVEPPTGEITVSGNTWDSYTSSVTFDLFFGTKQSVEITAYDTTEEAVSVEYTVTDRIISKSDIAKETFKPYTGEFFIEPNDKHVVYAKLTDKSGNTTYICSNGIVIDNENPVISGIVDGKTYCAAQVVTVTDDCEFTVQVNGDAVKLDKGQFTLLPKNGEQKIVVTDRVGNKTEMTVTVNDGHTPNVSDGDCTTAITCKHCGAVTTPAKTHDFSGALVDGETQHWHVCQNDGCICTDTKTAHSGTDDGDCTTAVLCVCGHTVKSAASQHAWGDAVLCDTDSSKHVRKCNADGCEQKLTEDHKIIKGKCADCGYEEVYTVTYTDGQGGTFFADEVYTAKYGEKTPELKADISSFAGWKFKKWDLNVTSTVTKSVTYTAQWQWKTSNEFILDGNGGVTPKGYTTSNHYTNAVSITAKANPFVRTGYTFAYWATNPDGSGDIYYPNTSEVYFTAAHNGEKITLYAVWNPIYYTVMYEPNGGTGEMLPQRMFYDSSYILTDNAFRKDGYVFDSWNTKSDGTGERFENKATVTNLRTENFSAVTLYAQWRDVTPAVGEIKIGEYAWTEFISGVTFGLFFKDSRSVTVNATDNSGKTVKVEYLITDEILGISDLKSKAFTPYEGSFTIDDENEYVIYVKFTDANGNVSYISSNGLVIDKTAPVILGVENGETYCFERDVTVNEKNIASVTVNGAPITLDSDNGFTLKPCDGAQTVTVTDKAGHTTSVTVTVNESHTAEDDGDCTTAVICGICNEVVVEANAEHSFSEWEQTDAGKHTRHCTCDGCNVTEEDICSDGDSDHYCDVCGERTSNHSGGTADCVGKAVCELCGEKYGEINPTNHAGLKHINAKSPTLEENGNIEYWFCECCGTCFADGNCEKEITLESTVIAKLVPETDTGKNDTATPDTAKPVKKPVQNTVSPATGDDTPVTWLALLLASGGALACVPVLEKKKKSKKI